MLEAYTMAEDRTPGLEEQYRHMVKNYEAQAAA
jgi:hypothetical protein